MHLVISTQAFDDIETLNPELIFRNEHTDTYAIVSIGQPLNLIVDTLVTDCALDQSKVKEFLKQQVHTVEFKRETYSQGWKI